MSLNAQILVSRLNIQQLCVEVLGCWINIIKFLPKVIQTGRAYRQLVCFKVIGCWINIKIYLNFGLVGVCLLYLFNR